MVFHRCLEQELELEQEQEQERELEQEQEREQELEREQEQEQEREQSLAQTTARRSRAMGDAAARAVVIERAPSDERGFQGSKECSPHLQGRAAA